MLFCRRVNDRDITTHPTFKIYTGKWSHKSLMWQFCEMQNESRPLKYVCLLFIKLGTRQVKTFTIDGTHIRGWTETSSPHSSPTANTPAVKFLVWKKHHGPATFPHWSAVLARSDSFLSLRPLTWKRRTIPPHKPFGIIIKHTRQCCAYKMWVLSTGLGIQSLLNKSLLSWVTELNSISLKKKKKSLFFHFGDLTDLC